MLRPLFSPDGDAALAATLALRPLLAFDFDGTLAPIVARPADARVPLPTARRLDRLAAAAAGGHRQRPQHRRRARAAVVRAAFVIGSHGAEDPHAPHDPDAPARLDRFREPCCGRAPASSRRPASSSRTSSIRWPCTTGWRATASARRALVDEVVGGLAGELDTFGGKMVMNIVAAGAPRQGRRGGRPGGPLRRARCAVFLGDDVNDEPVFARAEPDWLTVKVGRDPNSQARFFIDGTGEIAQLLDRMLALLEAMPPAAGR